MQFMRNILHILRKITQFRVLLKLTRMELQTNFHYNFFDKPNLCLCFRHITVTVLLDFSGFDTNTTFP